jgi:hypothetical protein
VLKKVTFALSMAVQQLDKLSAQNERVSPYWLEESSQGVSDKPPTKYNAA